jgi:hypothetical protein
MFNETHSIYLDEDNSINLTFIKSLKVQAYPCGRRRGLIDKDGNGIVSSTDSYLPFDPEARLNTEANNRKYSSLNGYTQTYLKEWDGQNKLLTMSLAGYLFNIDIGGDYATVDSFGQAIAKVNEDITARVYANIVIEDVHLFSGFHEYYTGVLRDQAANVKSSAPEASLDLLNTDIANNDIAADRGLSIDDRRNANNFYFSGLSFSAAPITGGENVTRKENTVTCTRENASGQEATITQTWVSLCILEKVEGVWQIHQPAYLPKIEHGTGEDSITIDSAEINSTLTAKEAKITTKTILEGEFVVKNDDPAKAVLNNALITGTLVVTNPELNPENPNYNPSASPAGIVADNAGIATISAGTIEAENIQQKIGDDSYNVPIICLEEMSENNKTFYQLQISRINFK